MPVIEQSIWIQAPVEKVYAIAREVERFPEVMPDLESVKVLERSEDGSRTVTEWTGLVREFNNMRVKWTEEDLWDDAEHTCRFRLLKGDLQRMEGEWRFVEENGGTRFLSRLEYEYNVPLLGALVKNLIHKKLEENVQMVLEGIRRRAEEGLHA
ncbi:MAG: SRPBCC family protein [Armatimonadota bacterium]|nr:SRPBCC family protein [Armatimonadota bacterium]MDW8103600.1 SRPBCC family protein [Armatimonadota bacterium]